MASAHCEIPHSTAIHAAPGSYPKFHLQLTDGLGTLQARGTAWSDPERLVRGPSLRKFRCYLSVDRLQLALFHHCVDSIQYDTGGHAAHNFHGLSHRG